MPRMPGARAARAAQAAEAAQAKRALRSRLIAARARRSPDDRTATGVAIATAVENALADPDHPVGRRRAGPAGTRLVAAYVSAGSEPQTGPLLARLAQFGIAVIVPVLLDDGDLDWAAYAPGDPLGPGLRGTTAPQGRRLGLGALADADLVLVPALAVDRQGHRLGRGGGSYDRALARAADGVPLLAVLHDDEIVDDVPALPHDHRVDGAVTPSGVALFGSHPAG